MALIHGNHRKNDEATLKLSRSLPTNLCGFRPHFRLPSREPDRNRHGALPVRLRLYRFIYCKGEVAAEQLLATATVIGRI